MLFPRQGTLFAQPFDASRQLLSGTAVSVAGGVAVNQAVGIAAIATGGGVIAYRTGAENAGRRLAWFERSGREIDGVAGPDRLSDWGPAISPDGRRIAVTRMVDGNEDVWLVNSERSAPTRLTFDVTRDTSPVFSPDGSRIVFTSTRSGTGQLAQKSRMAPEPKLLFVTRQAPASPLTGRRMDASFSIARRTLARSSTSGRCRLKATAPRFR